MPVPLGASLRRQDIHRHGSLPRPNFQNLRLRCPVELLDGP